MLWTRLLSTVTRNPILCKMTRSSVYQNFRFVQRLLKGTSQAVTLILRSWNLQSKLYLLSADPSTYLLDIEEDLHTRYSAWLDSLKNYEFDLLSHESLTKLLLSNTRLKENYETLVPEKVREMENFLPLVFSSSSYQNAIFVQVSHGEFWNRFLFRKALLEDEEAEHHRKKSMEKKFCDTLEWEKGCARW